MDVAVGERDFFLTEGPVRVDAVKGRQHDRNRDDHKLRTAIPGVPIPGSLSYQPQDAHRYSDDRQVQAGCTRRVSTRLITGLACRGTVSTPAKVIANPSHRSPLDRSCLFLIFEFLSLEAPGFHCQWVPVHLISIDINMFPKTRECRYGGSPSYGMEASQG